jgi:branched-chain amino acid transport system substrate-binding protein
VIGVLTDQSGIGASVSGPPLVQAVRMAVEDTGLLPDRRPLSVVTDAFLLKPDDAVAIARRWFDQGVSAIVDVPSASAATAVQALAWSRGRTTLITGSLSAELTGRDCSPFGSHWSIDSALMATALTRTLARGGRKSWLLVVPDTVPGLAVQADAIRAIEDAGGQVLARSRHPAETTDFASIVAGAKASGAQAVGLCDISGALGAQLPGFLAAGLFGDGQQTVAFCQHSPTFIPSARPRRRVCYSRVHSIGTRTTRHVHLQIGSLRQPGRCPTPPTRRPMSRYVSTCAPRR